MQESCDLAEILGLPQGQEGGGHARCPPQGAWAHRRKGWCLAAYCVASAPLRADITHSRIRAESRHVRSGRLFVVMVEITVWRVCGRLVILGAKTGRERAGADSPNTHALIIKDLFRDHLQPERRSKPCRIPPVDDYYMYPLVTPTQSVLRSARATIYSMLRCARSRHESGRVK